MTRRRPAIAAIGGKIATWLGGRWVVYIVVPARNTRQEATRKTA